MAWGGWEEGALLSGVFQRPVAVMEGAFPGGMAPLLGALLCLVCFLVIRYVCVCMCLCVCVRARALNTRQGTYVLLHMFHLVCTCYMQYAVRTHE